MGIDIVSYRMRIGLFGPVHGRLKSVSFLTQFECLCWLSIILLKCGDVHKNPGPTLHNQSDSTSDTSSLNSDPIVQMKNNMFSFVHYNIQSLVPKLDIVTHEFQDFDVIAFSETWLHESVSQQDIRIPHYHPPIRKDRETDHYGGVAIYIKDNIFYKRRHDLETQGIECICAEIQISKSKTVLFGTFYRAPNLPVASITSLEHSIALIQKYAI